MLPIRVSSSALLGSAFRFSSRGAACVSAIFFSCSGVGMPASDPNCAAGGAPAGIVGSATALVTCVETRDLCTNQPPARPSNRQINATAKACAEVQFTLVVVVLISGTVCGSFCSECRRGLILHLATCFGFGNHFFDDGPAIPVGMGLEQRFPGSDGSCSIFLPLPTNHAHVKKGIRVLG